MRIAMTILLLLGVGVVLVALLTIRSASSEPKPVRIGVLYSLTGTMAVSEAPLVDAIRLAIDEINGEGGLLGRRVEMTVVDGQSDWQVFVREVERLIVQERVSALFACWTSSCRKVVKPVLERHRHLLFYAVQYEGFEDSPNIIYTGSTPNQQIMPGTRWALDRFGKRVYLIGSDYIFPRTANLLIRDLISTTEGHVLGERYLPLGSRDAAAIVADIVQKRPDVVLNSLNGDSNAAFFAELLKAGQIDLPIVSFSITEGEMRAWGGDRFARHYAVLSYFQSLDRAENRRFVEAFKSRFGRERSIGDAMEAAYVGVKLWAQAVRDAQSARPERVNQTIVRQSVNGPSAIASVDTASRHLWKIVRIGHVLPGGQFEQVYATERPLRPAPWLNYRTREQWRYLMKSMETDHGEVDPFPNFGLEDSPDEGVQ